MFDGKPGVWVSHPGFQLASPGFIDAAGTIVPGVGDASTAFEGLGSLIFQERLG